MLKWHNDISITRECRDEKERYGLDKNADDMMLMHRRL